MNEQIPQLTAYDEATLDRSFTLIEDEVRETAQSAESEAFRLHWLGRKQGRLKLLSEAWLQSAPTEARRPLGIRFNQLKQSIEAVLESPRAIVTPKLPALDITLPGVTRRPGIPHPLRATMDRVVEVFHHLGFSTELGPQVESDFYNFEALNFPENHPRPRHARYSPDRRGREANPVVTAC